MSAHVEPVTDAMRGESRPEADQASCSTVPQLPAVPTPAPVTGTGARHPRSPGK